MKIERRAPNLDDARMSTQRLVTYVLLTIFASVTAAVFIGQDQAERSTILQTVINLTLIAVGFWLGSSKGSMDKDASISRIAEASAPVAAAAVAAANSSQPIKTDEVKVEAQSATVTTSTTPQKGLTP